MSAARIWTIARLELMQRLRSAGWYVLLGVFALVMLIATVLSFLAFSFQPQASAGIYSVIVMLVLLLVVLISPTLSGSSINGDREAATLVSVQVTLASTGDIMLGKLLAAVLTGSAFLAVAVPFLLVGMLAGRVTPGALIVSLLVLAAEIVIVAAIGVGWSGLLSRPLFSVASTYLVVAALAVGTLIAFWLGGAAIQTEAVSKHRPFDQSTGQPICDGWVEDTVRQPRFDYVWGFLAANPFVVLADATPTTYDDHGNPLDMFGQLKAGIRAAQHPPVVQVWDECTQWSGSPYPTPQESIESSAPSWFVGLSIQIVLAGGLFAGAWARTRTPARRLPPNIKLVDFCRDHSQES